MSQQQTACYTLGSNTLFAWENIPICRDDKASLKTTGHTSGIDGMARAALLSHLTACSLTHSFALPAPLPPTLLSSATYPVLSEYKFRDFASGKRVKLYPLQLDTEFCFTSTFKSRYLATSTCLFLLSARTKQRCAQVYVRNSSSFADLTRYHPAAKPPQQPAYAHLAHPKHHMKEV